VCAVLPIGEQTCTQLMDLRAGVMPSFRVKRTRLRARKRAAVSRSVKQIGSACQHDLTLGDRTETLNLCA
jgi:hypothetical protein